MVSDNNDNIIRGKALYFSTSQVANVLNEADSKIRYYTNVFDDILHIEISNKQRRYTDADIDKLRFIIELKNEGMTIKQIQEYCQEVDFEDSKEIQIKENNPLSIQAIAKALLEQQAILIDNMKQDIIESVISRVNERLDIQDGHFDSMKNSLSKEVAITVEDIVYNRLEESFKGANDTIADNLKIVEENIIKENEKQFEIIKEDNKKEYEKFVNDFKCVTQKQLDLYKEQNQPKSFLERIFGKKQ